jgi:hypothetical protein
VWKKNAALFLFLTLTSVLLSPNCATLTRKRTQRIPVTSDPAGAKVSVNGIQKGATPFEIKLARAEKNQVIRIESPGYNPVEIRVRRKFSGFHVMADGLLGAVLGGGIALSRALKYDETLEFRSQVLLWGPASIAAFLIVDAATTAGYTFKPTDLIVTLTKAAGSPRVDTMFIDVEDFQNIKWIRVHRD